MNATQTWGSRLAGFWQGKARVEPRRRTRAAAIRVEGLEGRRLLTGSATLNAAGQLIINGTNYADTVTVGKSGSQIVVIQYSSDLTKSARAFSAAQVKVIGFQGYGGNDTFNNLTAINSAALGGSGSDLLFGGYGRNYLDGGDGNDVLIGGPLADTLYGGGGQDVLDGGAGNDELHGGGDNDVLIGGAGNDLLLGEDGTDLLLGGSGMDKLDGGAGQDVLDGGSGYDTITDSLAANFFRDDAGVLNGYYYGTGTFQAGHVKSDSVTAVDLLNARSVPTTPPSNSPNTLAELNAYLSYQFAQMNQDPTNSALWDQVIPGTGQTLRKLSQAPNEWRAWHAG